MSSSIKRVKGPELIPSVVKLHLEAVAVNPQHVVEGTLNAMETGHH